MKDSKKKPNELNEFLRSERKLRNWTQEDLAYELSNICDEDEVSERGEINFKMVGSWERGEHTPSNFWQKKMCKLFGKNVLELGFVVSPMVNTQEYSQKEMYTHASSALTVASQTKSPEVLQRIHKLRATLEPWADTSYVKALDKQIRPVELQFRGKKRL